MFEYLFGIVIVNCAHFVLYFFADSFFSSSSSSSSCVYQRIRMCMCLTVIEIEHDNHNNNEGCCSRLKKNSLVGR